MGLGMVTKELLLERLAGTDLGTSLRQAVEDRINRDFSQERNYPSARGRC
jgi:hypothetical protein